MDEIVKRAEQMMVRSVQALEANLAKIRTGRAHPNLLDGVKLEYYGTLTQLNQLANITVADARTLLIAPWEAKIAPDVARAVRDFGLGLNPQVDGGVVRVPLPELTGETRSEYAKRARKEAEEARVSVRNARREANAQFKSSQVKGDMAEDEARKGQAKVQNLTDRNIAEIEELLAQKERELLEV